jgi:hypothetical protein
MCIKFNKVGKEEVGIWWVQECYPQYGIPIWLPSTVTEKNATKNILDGWKDVLSEKKILNETKNVAFLDPSDSYFLFADFVDFYTHWTYMLIFRCIFLSNYWWQKSDIWSQASYMYPILWVAFFDPSDSYFLFADLHVVGFYTHWTYVHIFRHIFLSNYWWQRSDIWS